MSAGGSLDRGELNSLQLKLNAAAGQLAANGAVITAICLFLFLG